MRPSLLVPLLLLALSTPAAAFDPDARRAREDPPDRGTEAARLGLHQVTEVFAGERILHAGSLTTYTTDTVHRRIETFARAIATVGTSERSPLDGAAFNGRGTLSTGEPLAGTFFQDFVWNGRRFTPVNIVFFQDDSELDRNRTKAAVPAPRAASTEVVRAGAEAGRIPSSARFSPTPEPDGLPPAPPAPEEVPDREGVMAPRVQIGLDPSGGSSLADALEVLRGRRYELVVNARGVPAVRLEAWQLVAGVDDAWNAPGWHEAHEPLIGTWLRLPSPGGTWTLTLRVRARRVGGGPSFEVQAPITIVVRSPAVVE